MTCPSCEQAKINRWCGAYHADCLECSARALSASPEHWKSREAGKMTITYKNALRTIFGGEWEAGHKRVKDWADRNSRQKV